MVAQTHGRLDILVNSAGLGQNVTPIVELGDEEWERVLNVNLNGTFKCCRAAARFMERQESGCIVNLASINGQNPAAWVAAYNVAQGRGESPSRVRWHWSSPRTASASTRSVPVPCTRTSTGR